MLTFWGAAAAVQADFAAVDATMLQEFSLAVQARDCVLARHKAAATAAAATAAAAAAAAASAAAAAAAETAAADAAAAAQTAHPSAINTAHAGRSTQVRRALP